MCCLCASVCVSYMCVHVYVCMFVDRCIVSCACVCITHVRMRVYDCMYVYMSIGMRARVCEVVYVYTRVCYVVCAFRMYACLCVCV